MMSTGKTALLVAEREGDWSAWVEPLREQSEDVTVVLQRQGESSAELASRVRARVEELAQAGEIVAAALVAGPSFDNETLAARTRMVRAIVGPMAASGGGQLFLDGGARSGRGRHAMQALASALEGYVGESVLVSAGVAQPVRRAA
jgi:hypothetical protein